jgi:beta-galactosidase/beta-glucuronidase
VRDRNIGIWQDVFISSTGTVDIRSPFIAADLPLPSMDYAELKVTAELANLTDSEKKGVATINILSKNCEGRAIILRKPVELMQRQVLRIQFDSKAYPELRIKDPNLWWPNGQGEQNLYELELVFELDGERTDLERRTFGIREIDTKVTEENGWARREFFINGQKILLKGGAWVPDMMLNRDLQKLFYELRLSAEANLNTVRIWGGGMTPPEEFFSSCDELGLMVWHDFWITGDCQGTWDKGSQDYPFEGDVFLKNAADVVKKLRNHPSLFIWTAGNEGYPRKDIYVPLRNEIVAKLDGTRPFIPSSGFTSPPEGWGLSLPDDRVAGTYSGGPYHWVDPREYYTKVDDGKDWLFKNEVGLPALPVLESLKKFIPDLNPDKDVKFPLNNNWGYHDACEGNGKYSLYDEAIRRRYGEPEDLADYVLKAQLINAESYRAVFEAVNQAMDRVGGVLLWKTNPAWPSVIWQIYDWYLCPHAGYYYVKKACEPLHIQLNLDDHGISVVNNLLVSQNDLSAAVSLYSLEMKKVWSKDTRFSVDPASSQELFKMEIPEKEKDDIFIAVLDLKNKNNNLVSENFYWIAQNDDYKALSELPRVDLKVDAEQEESDNKITLKLRFFNHSSDLAFFIHPSIRKGERGEEVLPSFWSDNYFSILPGSSKEVKVGFQREDFCLEQAYLKLEGWNVVPQMIELESILAP